MQDKTHSSYKQLEQKSKYTNMILRWYLYFVLVTTCSDLGNVSVSNENDCCGFSKVWGWSSILILLKSGSKFSTGFLLKIEIITENIFL